MNSFKTLATYNKRPLNYCGKECELYTNIGPYNNVYNAYTNCKKNNAGYGAYVFESNCSKAQNFNTLKESTTLSSFEGYTPTPNACKTCGNN